MLLLTSRINTQIDSWATFDRNIMIVTEVEFILHVLSFFSFFNFFLTALSQSK